jgi:hypothetical protein
VGGPAAQLLGESYGTLIGQTYANLFPHRVRVMALDGLVDAVVATTSTEVVLASASRDTDRVFGAFLRLCEAAGRDRCALAGHGPVAARVDRLLAELRRSPIPVPSGELTYAEALTALKCSGLVDPALWPEVAAVLELAVEGDASVLDAIASGQPPTRPASSSRSRAWPWSAPTARPATPPPPGRGWCVAWRPSAASAGRRWAGSTPRARPGRPPHQPLGRRHQASDPGHRHPVRPQHVPGQRPAGRAPAGQRRPAFGQ